MRCSRKKNGELVEHLQLFRENAAKMKFFRLVFATFKVRCVEITAAFGNRCVTQGPEFVDRCLPLAPRAVSCASDICR